MRLSTVLCCTKVMCGSLHMHTLGYHAKLQQPAPCCCRSRGRGRHAASTLRAAPACTPRKTLASTAARSRSRASSPPCPCAKRGPHFPTGVQARAGQPFSGLQLLYATHCVPHCCGSMQLDGQLVEGSGRLQIVWARESVYAGYS